MFCSKFRLHLFFFFVSSFVFITTAQAAPKPKSTLTLKRFLDAMQPAKEETPQKKAKEPTENIDSIHIEGLQNIPESFVLDELTLRAGEELNAVTLATIVKNIRSKGVFSSVKTSITETPQGKKITFIVKEKPLIKKIEFDGATVFSKEELQGLIESKEGTVLNLQTIKKDIALLNEHYSEKGYLQSRVLNVQTPEADNDPLVFKILEQRITEIFVTGNRVTKPYVILREMETKPGAILQADKLKEDLRKIYNLGYFTDLKPLFLPGKTPYSQALGIDVTEKSSFGSFQFGGSYSGVGGGYLFSNLNWENLGGTGQTVMLTAQLNISAGTTGNKANTYQIKYYNPWMWDERKSFSFKSWLRNGSVENFLLSNASLSSRDEQSFGIEVGVGIPLNYQTRIEQFIKYENVTTTSNSISSPTQRTYTIQSYKVIGSYDTRDYMFNPQEGVYYTLGIERAYPFYNHSINFTRYDLELRNFFRVIDQQVFATRLVFGYLESPALDDATLFSREYYRLGGATTVRGYDELNPFAYGSQQVILSLEYRFLFTDAFQIILFADAGYASNFVKDDGARTPEPVGFMGRFKIGKGIGTRLTIPVLGAIRLDFGMDEKENSRIHLNMGGTF